ncbi:hypothetical protein G6F37_008432 [Rhizopus arrhizus]|nr:hypothetical protein G6F38_006906 [Rhizopus arrhizus]KAG1155564.1 hypothetical protein G6F37_008432 [Rhizopus arrhizus]
MKSKAVYESAELIESQPLTEDDIDSFSSQEMHPTAKRPQESSRETQPKKQKRLQESKEEERRDVESFELKDMLTMEESISDVPTPDASTLDSPIEEFSSAEEEEVKAVSRVTAPMPLTRGLEPKFTNLLRPAVPLPTLPQYLRRRHLNREDKKFIEFKKGGIAEKALSTLVRQRDEFNAWERGVNASMAKYGSIIKVCSQSPGSRLFRLMDPWIERGLVFAWCVPLKESEIQQVIGTPVSSQFSREEDSQDIIEDFSQPSSLPPYEPEQGHVCPKGKMRGHLAALD